MIVLTCNQIWPIFLAGLCPGNCSYTQFSYTINGQPLEEVTDHKDLGVVFKVSLSRVSDNLKNRILGMIKRSFTALNQSTLLLLYKHLVRPCLEYCNTVWNLGYLTDKAKLEKVQ